MTHGRFVVVPAAYVFLLRDGRSSTPPPGASTTPPPGASGTPPSGASGTPPSGASGTEVLLQLRQNTGFMDGHWAAAAAGHVERGETAYAAAHREALEELGITGLELEFVTSMQRTRGGEPIDERVDFFFTARRWTGEPRITEPEKSAGLAWYPLDDLPDPVVPHERAVLAALCEGPVPGYTTHGFDDDSRGLADGGSAQ